MIRSPRHAAFTLIEMITVIAIIVILVSLVLAINGLVQRKSAMARADAEIKLLSQACESYKTDNGGYPQDTAAGSSSVTSSLDPRVTFVATNYYAACSFLYVQLSGDTNANGVIDNGETATNYLPDFFKPSRLAGQSNGQAYILDPYGNSYGYSTAGLLLQQEYLSALSTNSSATKPTSNSAGTVGYNNTFDMWSTGGTSGSGTYDTAKWIKNW
jgi:prepilin-type N-terminal cleavage/methylation domain-containing protein